MSQIIIGFCTEGPTDVRFLESVVQRTFEDIAFECIQQVEILPIQHLRNGPGTFVEAKIKALQDAFERGVMVCCIHIDADAATSDNVHKTRIYPLMEAMVSQINICDNIVPIIPIQMTESWMLADTNLLKQELGTDKTDVELGFNRPAEAMADPKKVLNQAITIVNADLPKRRRYQLRLSDIYQPIGQKIDLSKLRALSSFQAFEAIVRQALININYLY